MLFFSWNFILLLAFAILFYRGGQFDNGHGLPWAIMSLTISMLTWQWLHWGPLGMLLGQMALFIGLTIFRKLPRD